MTQQRGSSKDGTIHVMPGKVSWVVTRIAPQFNASFHDAEGAVVQARTLAQKDGALMLVHRSDGDVIDREDYNIPLPEIGPSRP